MEEKKDEEKKEEKKEDETKKPFSFSFGTGDSTSNPFHFSFGSSGAYNFGSKPMFPFASTIGLSTGNASADGKAEEGEDDPVCLFLLGGVGLCCMRLCFTILPAFVHTHNRRRI